MRTYRIEYKYQDFGHWFKDRDYIIAEDAWRAERTLMLKAIRKGWEDIDIEQTYRETAKGWEVIDE